MSPVLGLGGPGGFARDDVAVAAAAAIPTTTSSGSSQRILLLMPPPSVGRWTCTILRATPPAVGVAAATKGRRSGDRSVGCAHTTGPLPTAGAGVVSDGGHRSHPQTRHRRRRAADQPRALLPRLRRPPARPGARRDAAAARARLLPQGLGRDAGRVLHGPDRRADRPDRSRREPAPARRPHAAADTRRRPRARPRAVRQPGEAVERRALPRSRRRADRRLERRRARAGGARRARRPLRARDLPGADAARGRARPAVPLHLRALDQPRPVRGRPRDRRGALRPGQGAGGPATLLPRRAERPLRAARARPLPLPARALPRDGDPRAVALPRHARRRSRGGRRGRRPARGRRAPAAPRALRRGDAARGVGVDVAGDAASSSSRGSASATSSSIRSTGCSTSPISASSTGSTGPTSRTIRGCRWRGRPGTRSSPPPSSSPRSARATCSSTTPTTRSRRASSRTSTGRRPIPR